MPYIKKKRRLPLAPHTDVYPETLGELSYQITRMCDWYLQNSLPNSADDIMAVIGCLDATKLELWRRVMVPYEEEKIDENGDVFTKEVKTGSEPEAGGALSGPPVLSGIASPEV